MFAIGQKTVAIILGQCWAYYEIPDHPTERSYGAISNKMNARENTVLSYSRDPAVLAIREWSLRKGGFEVISVGSEAEARLEIEMGRCGILLVCTNVRDLIRLFRRYCADGRIIFVRTAMSSPPPKTADYVVEESEGPEAIVEVLRSSSGNISKKAS